MEYRKIGDSELRLSLFGLGCWAFGGGDYWGSDHDQSAVNDVVHHAVDLGVNYFDSAEVYNEGRSESSLGMAIKGITRDKLIIGTKISPSNCFPGKVSEYCEESLKRLDTDYVDIYMIHWPIHPHSIRHFTQDQDIINKQPALSDTLDELLKLKQEGKIRNIGVSNHNAKRLDSFPSNVGIAVNELPYNLLCRAPEYEILPYCKRKGIGVIGYMSLLQGILAGIYPDIDSIPPMMRRTRHFDSRKNELSRHGEHGAEIETNMALEGIREIAAESGISMPDLAIKWAVANSAISSSLVGVRAVTRLEANIKAINEPLDDQIISKLNKVTEGLKKKLGNLHDYYESIANDRT